MWGRGGGWASVLACGTRVKAGSSNGLVEAASPQCLGSQCSQHKHLLQLRSCPFTLTPSLSCLPAFSAARLQPPRCCHNSSCRLGHVDAEGGGQQDDLTFVVQQQQHPAFRRLADDLYVQVNVPLVTGVCFLRMCLCVKCSRLVWTVGRAGLNSQPAPHRLAHIIVLALAHMCLGLPHAPPP